MNILSTFAQTYYDTAYGYDTTSNGTGDDAVVVATLVLSFFLIVTGIILYIILSLSLMSIFKKAGVKPWIAWVPVYNQWKFLELGGQKGFWAVLMLIPVVQIVSSVFIYIAMYHVGKKLEKSSEFVIIGIFLPIVWYIWLAVDKSKWNDKASTAPSLHHA